MDEPWDSEHNKKLIPRMPDFYKLPGRDLGFKTPYQLVTGKDTMYRGNSAIEWDDIRDEDCNTILLVESDPDRAVIWTKPDDFEVDLRSPRAGLGGNWSDGFHVMFADHHVVLLPHNIENKTLAAFFTPSGAADGREAPVFARNYYSKEEQDFLSGRTRIVEEPIREQVVQEPAPDELPSIEGHAPRRFATPEECFSAMQKANRERDTAAILDCYTATGQNLLVGVTAFFVEREVFFQTERREAAAALLKQHGLGNADITGMLQVASMPGGVGENKAFASAGRQVKKKAEFLAAVVEMFGQRQGPIPQVGEFDEQLADVTIDGDEAKAMVVRDDGELKEIKFKRIGEGWRIDGP